MAASLNKVMLIGRLGRDPELRYTQGGTPVANFSMATDESYRGKDGNTVEQTEWHNIVAWGRQGENCANYLSKGSLVFVEGSLQTRKWQDKQGQDRWTTEIKAFRVQFLDTKGSSNARAGNDGPPPHSDSDLGPAPDDDLGPAFPSEASGMDDVPF